MNRFQEDTPSNAAHMLKIWEGPDAIDILCYEAQPLVRCDGCNQGFPADQLTEEPDPKHDCTCLRLDVDYYDSRGCWSCDPKAAPRLAVFCRDCMAEIEPEVVELPVIARVPVGRAQGELFVEEVA